MPLTVEDTPVDSEVMPLTVLETPVDSEVT